ncbi:MAG: UDP-N-acetylmuramoyl-L-alanyl-D-glutamate--2,6-diaminopimelate ligase [Bdellovibrionales bacterium]|nr:UDP-N-acetylmuramoyl-L-alanyl-D-glutamate--2,6-diaminopimelate ligase [Bdellovibrionales bacterium]
MKLAQLLSIFEELHWGADFDAEVFNVTVDSREVKKNSVYVAIRGTKVDGHTFLPQVAEKGAIALIVESKDLIPSSYKGAVVVTENSRSAIDQIASRFYGDPAEYMFCVGVTGTNGKTSITYMVEAIFKEFGWTTGVMGTVDHHLGDHVWKSHMTTPGPVELQKRLSEFRALHADAAVFEVSSHALDQHRVDHIPFNAIVFSNLSRDHMDYHKDFEDYFKAKERLFSEIPYKYKNRKTTAVINADDPYGLKIETAGGVRSWYYGEKRGDFRFEILDESFQGCRINVRTPRGEHVFTLPLTGRHNIYNCLAAITVGMSAGASLDVCCNAMEKFKGVPGRLEKVENDKGLHVFVDYAHTDDALTSVLKSLNSVRKKNLMDEKLITIFGCGGDRDKGKRPMMTKAALDQSDLVFITSDNPRSEDPMLIIKDCLKAVPEEMIDKTVFIEQDRKTALSRAFKMANVGDIVLIAGKGHEDYQIVGDQVLPFSDVLVAKELLK